LSSGEHSNGAGFVGQGSELAVAESGFSMAAAIDRSG